MEINKKINYKFLATEFTGITTTHGAILFDFSNTSDSANEENLKLILSKEESKNLLKYLLQEYKDEKL